ncbi:MAG: nucleotide pyrophosphohydrolase [Firmicutes bacterium]|nr:nucleotide pyrophosphohydrolase [Bacillota bacterium]
MAQWVWQDGDRENDEFVIPGPISGKAVWDRFGPLFPEDAPTRLMRANGTEETISWRQVPSLTVETDERLLLPGIPVAGGPLLYVMARLLGPDGCPWDKKQTPQSLLRYLLDESYEAAEALVANDQEAFIEELGDVLLQVAFQGSLLSGTSFSDIAERQAQKLVRRHPHVFAEETWANSEEVRQQWDNLKAQEPQHTRTATWVYPGLVAAKRLDKAGIRPESAVYQEILALLEVYFDKSPGKIEEILADAAWAVASGGRIHHQDAEWALWQKLARMARKTGEISRNLR